MLDGVIWPSQRLTGEEQGTGADVELLSVGARACWAVVDSDVEIAPCLTLAVEHVQARGTGDHVAPRSDAATWVAGGAGAEAGWRFASWFAVILRVNAQLQASRPRLAIDGGGTVGQIGPVEATLLLGPEWIF
jgi:hypothetical protein